MRPKRRAPLPVSAKLSGLEPTGAFIRNAPALPALANSVRGDPAPDRRQGVGRWASRRPAAGRPPIIQIRKVRMSEWKKNPEPCAESANLFTKPYKRLSGTGRKGPFCPSKSGEIARKCPKPAGNGSFSGRFRGPPRLLGCVQRRVAPPLRSAQGRLCGRPRPGGQAACAPGLAQPRAAPEKVAAAV